MCVCACDVSGQLLTNWLPYMSFCPYLKVLYAASNCKVVVAIFTVHHVSAQGPLVLGDTSTTTLVSAASRQSTEGSLSDSGISDSGSEQELSERERRLAALRRLARHLEAVLAPGSEALVNMAKVGAKHVLFRKAYHELTL
jgi:hypothetical protein